MMEKIKNINEVIYYLYQQEIVCSIRKHKATYFALRDEKIVAKSMNATYLIDEETLVELFEEEAFYLYEKQEEDASEEALLKDKEYYSWTHK